MWACRIALAAPMLAGMPAALAAQDAPLGREVVGLRFEGANAFSKEKLQAAIATQQSGCKVLLVCMLGVARTREYLNAAALAVDTIRLRYFYFQRGYREARVTVDTVPAEQGLRVVFRIREGRPVRVTSLEVEGAAGFLPDGIATRLPLHVGDPLNLITVEASRDSLISALRNRGYPRADALIGQIFIPTQTREAEVQFLVIPGIRARFGEIEITGAERISESVIRRMLTFRTGDTYRQSALASSQSSLFGLNVFQNVSVRPIDDPSVDSVIPVRIQVNEGDINRFRIGVGGNSQDCVNAEGRWTSRNFFGGARRLEVRGLVSNVLAGPLHGPRLCHREEEELDNADRKLSGSLSVDLTQPWLFGPRNTFGAGVFIERRSLPDVFIRHARGGYVTLTRSLGSRTSLSLGFRPERTALDATGGDLYFCVSFVACTVDPHEQNVLSQPNWLNPVTLSFARDRTGSIFFPNHGYILSVDAEYASEATASDFPYARATTDLSWYRDIGRGVILASRVRVGRAWTLEASGESGGIGLHPQKRFFAGGANSVRGFAQYRLGPKVLRVDAAGVLARDTTGGRVPCTAEEINGGTCSPALIGVDRFDPRPVGGEALLESNVELRFPIYGDKWSGAAFLDAGQVWRRGRDLSLADLVFTPGLGIRYNSPIGPLRVDVGFNPQGGQPWPVITTEVEPVLDANDNPIIDLETSLPELRNTRTLRVLQDQLFWNPRRSFWNRLQFNFSIGQAF